jgi:Integrase zinc binding domain
MSNIAGELGQEGILRRWIWGTYELVQKLQRAYAENPSLDGEGETGKLVVEEGSKWLKGDDGTYREFVPPAQGLREEVVAAFHDREIAGHFGVKKTLKAVHRGFYWPRMDQDVHKYVTTCDACQRNKPLAGKPQGQHTPLPIAN